MTSSPILQPYEVEECEAIAFGPTYAIAGETVTRTLALNGVVHEHSIGLVEGVSDPELAWHVGRLRGMDWKRERPKHGSLEIVDLFCGAGGFSSGVSEAVRSLGSRPKTILAIDQDSNAVDVHAKNMRPVRSMVASVRDVLNIEPILGSGVSSDLDRSRVRMPDWPDAVGEADVVIGGPPCQGHSNFNNVTRRSDPRNDLYLWMPAAAHASNAKILIVENVASVKTDSGGAVDLAIELLGQLGYVVTFDDVLAAADLGVAQTRKRHFLVAVRRDVLNEEGARDAAAWLRSYRSHPVTVMDAIEDLQEPSLETEFDTPSNLSKENLARIDWLFDNERWDLADTQRPASHRDGNTYPSVYGRMRADAPSLTLTTGFLSPGRGRYVHPTRRRTLTPHEGARIQGFPDSFQFVGDSKGEPPRTYMATMIGDAVPPPMAFHVGLAAMQMVDW